MALLAFFLGLALGIGLWFWQYTQFQRKLRHLLRTLETDASPVSLPTLNRLRRQIAIQQEQHEQLQAQLRTWQQLLQMAPIGYLQVDEENQLIWCNQQAEQLLNLQRKEPEQVRLLLELVRSYELDQLIVQTREQQQPQVREWVFYPPCADAAAISSVRALTLRGYSFALQQGQVGVFLENRQPLVELSQVRDRDLADLAHELRTPLTSIRLVVETLQEHLELPMRRWVERLLPEVNRLINLVQNWLDLNQLEAHPYTQLHCQSVELRSLIHSAWQTLEPLVQQKQLSLSYAGVETVWLRIDSSRLTQVFLNLFDNSIKYSPPQTTIHVEVNLLFSPDAQKQVQINVIDCGCGFAESDLPHVFERLYRGEPARSRQVPSNSLLSPTGTGSGLGLAIVRQIVLAHGGSVKAINHPDTGGAWIQIELPDVTPVDS